jgi:hypothetical protein
VGDTLGVAVGVEELVGGALFVGTAVAVGVALATAVGIVVTALVGVALATVVGVARLASLLSPPQAASMQARSAPASCHDA